MKKRRIIHALSILVIAGMFLSCSESDIGTSSSSDPLAAGNIEAVAAQKSHGDSPQKVFEEFQEMVKKVETMSKAEIDSLSDEEILKLGEPIIKITENTVKYDEKTLEKLSVVTRPLSENSRMISKAEHKEIVEQTEKIINSSGSKFEHRHFEVNEILEILIQLNGGDVVRCNTFFNVQGSTVYLSSGDNFDHANTI